jgi:hypothetical protein
MVQPTASPVTSDDAEDILKEDDSKKFKHGCGSKGEYTRICLEHKAYGSMLVCVAADIFVAVKGKLPPVATHKNKSKEKIDGMHNANHDLVPLLISRNSKGTPALPANLVKGPRSKLDH